MAMDSIETKRADFALHIDSIDSSGVFSGYASVFDVIDDQKDVIVKGAFTNTLKEKGTGIKLLWQHRQDEPIGIFDIIKEDTKGLFVQGRLLLDVQRAKEAYLLLKSGAINGMSFGNSLGDTDEIDFLFRGNSLKPFSPVHIKGERDGSGNITIRWTRRTRVGGDLRDFTDIALNEQEELYEIDILDGDEIIRTIKDIATTETVYSAAEQSADFGDLQSSITVAIYQISAVVGRGTVGTNII